MAYTENKSSFESNKIYDGQIYAIYCNPKGNGKVSEKDCLYVGKTTQKEVGNRFIQHVSNDQWAPWCIHSKDETIQKYVPWWKNNKDSGIDYDALGGGKKLPGDTWPFFPRQLIEVKEWTRFDIAAAEQYYIVEAMENGAKLLNNANALSQEKFNKYVKTEYYTLPRKHQGWWTNPGHYKAFSNNNYDGSEEIVKVNDKIFDWTYQGN